LSAGISNKKARKTFSTPFLIKTDEFKECGRRGRELRNAQSNKWFVD